jgi:hypothetical protein
MLGEFASVHAAAEAAMKEQHKDGGQAKRSRTDNDEEMDDLEDCTAAASISTPAAVAKLASDAVMAEQ